MSLGLFTKDANGDVWFDIDCISRPHPKHLVYNLNARPEDRVLLLYTGYIEYPSVAGFALIHNHVVKPTDVVNSLQNLLSAGVNTWDAARSESGYMRIVYMNNGGWVYDDVQWGAWKGLATVSVEARGNSVVEGTLYCIGHEPSAQDADYKWKNTCGEDTSDRLRSALQAAHDNNPTMIHIPTVRRPAKLSDCVRPFANENQLITEL